MTEPLYPWDSLNFDSPLIDIDGIRKLIPHRFEMEMLSAVVFIDPEIHGIVGYRDLTHEEFWCRGHMPGFPIMPGVLMCEAAAQLASVYCEKYSLLGGDFVGFGGMENVRFRDKILPGQRMIIFCKTTRLRRGQMAKFDFQNWVDGKLACEGEIIGVPLKR